MTFEQKVKSLTGKEIVMTMVRGLRNKWLEIDMDTYGEAKYGVCFGCAATSAVCELIGRPFRADEIGKRGDRASAIEADIDFLDYFEEAINRLRHGDIVGYNSYTERIGMSELPKNFDLPWLDNGFTAEELQAYEDWANTL